MIGYDLAVSTMDSAPGVSVRVNPFKPAGRGLEPDVRPSFIPADALKVPWSEWGWILRERPTFTLDPLFHAGAYYVQDSSAMFVGWLLRSLLPDRGPLKVLDLCAAPGGKTTDIAASLRLKYGADFELVSNEVMRDRAGVLRENVSIWGDPLVKVTSCDPAAFSQLGGYFDVIVADVPCSGEGMFRKDRRAFEEWSEDVVKLCSERQRRILSSVWPALKEGGLLVYSTCTFEESENDGNLRWAASVLGGEILTGNATAPFSGIRSTAEGFMLVPGEVPGEGQWAGALRKTSSASRARKALSEVIRPLRDGCPRGEMKGGTLVPDPDWALSLDYDSLFCPKVELDRHDALSFLHRDALKLPDAPLGYNAVCFEGYPLGFVKNLGTRCNSLLPKGRRILMDID